MSQKENNGRFYAFLAGGLIGAGFALLFAPRTGRETREQLKERMKDFEGVFKDQIDNVKEYTQQGVEKIRETAYNAAEEGRKQFEAEKRKAEEELNNMKTAKDFPFKDEEI